MKEIASLEEYFTLVRQDQPVVMVFTADWCPDCHYLKNFIDEVANAYEDRVSMYWVNRDQYGDLCETLDIMGIPSFVAYHKGQVITRFVNGKRKTREEVEAYLDETLGKVTA